MTMTQTADQTPTKPAVQLQLSDIQATVLRPRPSPYRGKYFVLRIDDAAQGRALLGKLLPHIAPAEADWSPSMGAWLGIAFSYAGLKALGLPAASLGSFPSAFQEGMAARAGKLGDVGANSPEHWEFPFGTDQVHITVAVYAASHDELMPALEKARQSHESLPGIAVVYDLEFGELPEGRNPFGFKDGLHNPPVEGFNEPSTENERSPFKAGEFLLGYEDETGKVSASPEPQVLGMNGAYVAFRKFHTDVAAFRSYLQSQSTDEGTREHLAAKMIGRWQSGAPLTLAPEQDDQQLGADKLRNNDFDYSDDLQGLKCPFSAHIRRVNPREALAGEAVAINLHQFLRRGTNYGPPLPPGILTDDGAARGGVFLFICAHLERQFEFVQSQWISDGNFISHGNEQDPLLGNPTGDGIFTIPQRPVRRRLHGLPQFVAVNGGEYLFMPSLSALKWLTELQ